MNLEQIRELLNKPRANFYVVTNELKNYVLESPRKESIVNNIVKQVKGKGKITTTDLFKLFYNETKYIVENTKYCQTTYATQMLLKTVWEQSLLRDLVVKNIRNNYFMYDVESLEEERKELSRAERLKRQAALMREAKARKAKERKLKEQKLKNEKVEEQNLENKKVEEHVKEENKKFTDEQLEQINLLKSLNL